MHIVFFASLSACIFVYFGYPGILFVLSRIRPRPVQRKSVRPSVSVIIPAHNEEEVIGRKINNTLGVEYPRELLEILIVSDGSTDATNEIVCSYKTSHVRLLPLPRCGKAQALNQGAREAQGEILAFTDANTLLTRDSLLHLVSNFADPAVGGVCGNKKYASVEGGNVTAQGENLYWRWDKWQKALESRIGSIFASDGAFHAVRSNLFVPIEELAVADDIAISSRVVLQGYRLVYEPLAVVFEEAPTDSASEFQRKIRVVNHSIRAMIQLKGALWRSGFYSFELLSHKLFRYLVPFFLIFLFGANAALATTETPFRALLLLQIIFYVVALAGFFLRNQEIGRLRLFTVTYQFAMVNLAALLGVLSVLRGTRFGMWVPRSGTQA
jgi:cellulose synthase/poly-beta-1,6-N-acetylglucosamine synthase-like glycosyltransferase